MDKCPTTHLSFTSALSCLDGLLFLFGSSGEHLSFLDRNVGMDGLGKALKLQPFNFIFSDNAALDSKQSRTCAARKQLWLIPFFLHKSEITGFVFLAAKSSPSIEPLFSTHPTVAILYTTILFTSQKAEWNSV